MSVFTTFPSYKIPRVPIVPVLIPAHSRIDAIIAVVVVLPFVPVIAMVFSFSAGLPKNSALIYASAFRVFSTLITATFFGTSNERSSLIIRAAAPFSTADCAYL